MKSQIFTVEMGIYRSGFLQTWRFRASFGSSRDDRIRLNPSEGAWFALWPFRGRHFLIF